MKKTWKKAISALLTLAMVTSVAPVTVMAEDAVAAEISVNTSDELVEAIEEAGDSAVTIKLADGEYKTNVKVPGGKNITITGSEKAVLSGQIATTSNTKGKLTIEGVTYNVTDIEDSTGISQTSKSAIAIWSNQTVICKDVTFNMSVSNSTAITSWWDTGVGTTIECYDCTFNCDGQRPIRATGNVTVEGCTFNDPYRYAIQLTAKASTATELDKAVVNFNGNTIVNGENGKEFVYGIQLEGTDYGCKDLIVNGKGNTIVDGGRDSVMYYCECGKVDHASVFWNVDEAPKCKNKGSVVAKVVSKDGGIYFETLAEAVEAAKDGETVVLVTDAKGAGIVIDKNITINFGGFTYDIEGPAVGSKGTTTLGFQIKTGNDVVLKNGIITECTEEENDEGVTNEVVKMLVQNYANLTLNNMVLDGSELGGSTGRYVLSNNSGNVTIQDTEIFADTEHNGIAFDVCNYPPYDVPTVTLKNVSAKGAFEVSKGLEGNLKIESGYFTQDPTDYVVAGKAVKESDKEGYEFMVFEPSKNKTKKYDVIIKQADNGDVEVDDDYAKRGQEITITVDPDKGYELDELTITDQNGDEVDYEKGEKENTFVFDMPKSDVTIEASFDKKSSSVADKDDEDKEDKEDEEDVTVQEPAEGADGTEKTTLILTIDQVIYQLNGNYAANDVAPVIQNDRTFLPIRLVAESLGATVGWNEAEQSVTIVKDGTTIVIYIGQAFATVNGTPVQLDAPAFIANDRTYLPVRFVAENLGATVSWDAETKEVTIIG